jgi:hypothetical protein
MMGFHWPSILKVCLGEHENCSWVMILFLLLMLSDLCLWLFLCISRLSGVLVKQRLILVCGYFSALVGFRGF